MEGNSIERCSIVESEKDKTIKLHLFICLLGLFNLIEIFKDYYKIKTINR